MYEQPYNFGLEPEAQPSKVEPATEILFLCRYDNCGKTFVDMAALRKHAHVHGGWQYVCEEPDCGKVSPVKDYFMPLPVPTLALANFSVFSCSDAKWI